MPRRGERLAALRCLVAWWMIRVMSVQVPPRGTRGAKAPPSGALGRALGGVARRVHRVTGNKMGGQPLLYLRTV